MYTYLLCEEQEGIIVCRSNCVQCKLVDIREYIYLGNRHHKINNKLRVSSFYPLSSFVKLTSNLSYVIIRYGISLESRSG
jgi:hypothetical protein